MVRDATFSDIPAIVSLLDDRFRRSHYASVQGGAIDAAHTKRLLVNAIQRHAGTSPGAMWVQVSEDTGIVRGFIWGILERVYSIGNRLSATDVFWIADDMVPARDPERLYRNFVKWAWSVPHVIEIKAGTTRAVADDDRAGVVLKRIGMADYGRIYRMEKP